MFLGEELQEKLKNDPEDIHDMENDLLKSTLAWNLTHKLCDITEKMKKKKKNEKKEKMKETKKMKQKIK